MNRDERPVSESSSEATDAQRPPRGRLGSNTVAVRSSPVVVYVVGQPVSGELIPRPSFTLCKNKSTACRLSSQWPRTDQTSRSHQFMNSTSDRSLIDHIVRFTPTTKSSDKSRSDRRLVQASTVRLPSIGRQIRSRSWFPPVGCLPLQ